MPELKSILLQDPKDLPEIYPPDFSEDEDRYLGNLRTRLEKTKEIYSQPFSEFDGMTYEQNWQKNEDLANTKIPPKKNKQDVQYASGTIRTKLFAFLSSLLGLNLSGDVSAYDENDLPVNGLGNGLEDIIEKTDELDEDEEKRMLRQYELLKQGYVFVEEVGIEGWELDKSTPEEYDGKFRGVKIVTKAVKKAWRPTRNILSPLSVYLGDLTKYLISDQPYLFTIKTIGYEEARLKYKDFEMFKHVPRTLTQFSGGMDKAGVKNWRLFDTVKGGQVEEIRYQCKQDKEYQILLDGIPMLPIGYPFPWGYDEYCVTQQNYKPIRHDFAFGKSFIAENKNPIELLDEMKKLGYLKTLQSFMPARANISGRIISSQVLMPGKITMSIKPGDIPLLDERGSQGVTSSEYNMIQELAKDIDRDTVSQTFTGSKEKGQTTATQIVELQRQAKMMLGITILTASLLEKKLVSLRLMNVLKKWFEPLDTVVDKARQVLKNRYRITARPRNIDGEGMGVRMVVPTEGLPSADEIRSTEARMKDQMGVPVRIIALNPKELAQAKLIWIVRVNPKEKKSSEMSKLMFRAEIQDAIALGLQLSPNYVQDRFAQVWEEDPQKMFVQGQQPVVQPQGTETTPAIKRPRVEVQQPERMMG
jgi:hypothetical protein